MNFVTSRREVEVIGPPPGMPRRTQDGVLDALWEGLGRDSLTRLQDPMGRRIPAVFLASGLRVESLVPAPNPTSPSQKLRLSLK